MKKIYENNHNLTKEEMGEIAHIYKISNIAEEILSNYDITENEAMIYAEKAEKIASNSEKSIEEAIESVLEDAKWLEKRNGLLMLIKLEIENLPDINSAEYDEAEYKIREFISEYLEVNY